MTQRRKTHRRILHRLALASLAALCIGAPVASAGPIDPAGTGTTTQDPRQQDMHASTVQKPDKVVVVRDARGESAAGGGTTGGTATKAPLPGPPTWPENPTPAARSPSSSRSRPATATTSASTSRSPC